MNQKVHAFPFVFFQQCIGVLPPLDCKVHVQCTEQFSQDPAEQMAKTLRGSALFLLDSVPHCGEDILGRISLSCKRRFLLCLLELAVYFAFEL